MRTRDMFVAMKGTLRAPGARFLFALALGVLALEASFRVANSLLFESTHLALFKPALARLHARSDVYVLGSSRLERAVLPSVFDAGLRETGIERQTFGIAIADTSLSILSYTCSRAAERRGLKAAIIEVSGPQLVDRPPDWEVSGAEQEGDLFEQRVQRAVVGSSALVRLRSALRFDSVVRFVAASAFAWSFDGSEHYGIDYVRAVIGQRATAEVRPVQWEPQLVVAKAAATPERYARALGVYQQCAAALARQGTRVSFVVPPLGPQYAGEEREAEFDQLLQIIAALGPVFDFRATVIPPSYMVDSHHLSTLGATQFSHRLAQLHAELPGWREHIAVQ